MGATVQAGEDKAIEIIIELLWRLKKEAGISLWFTGHTKRKSVSDIVTGEEYETLTSNMMAKYFNAIKTKLHILGVASVDRDIETVKKKQKMGGSKEIGKVKSESRIITFRDDNFNIDSKSRFSNIVDRIPLDTNEFINAINDAIKASFNKQKGSTSIKEEAKIQATQKVEKLAEKKEEREDEDYIDESANSQLLKKITEYATGDDAEDEVLAEISELFSETGMKSSNTDSIPTSIYRKAVALFE